MNTAKKQNTKKIDQKLWPSHLIVYRVNLPLFMDGNEDGVGDIDGLISKLDYLAELGVDAVWLIKDKASKLVLSDIELDKLDEASKSRQIQLIRKGTNLDHLNDMAMANSWRKYSSPRKLHAFLMRGVRSGMINPINETPDSSRLTSMIFGKAQLLDKEQIDKVAKLMATISLTLPGMVGINQGQELGLVDACKHWLHAGERSKTHMRWTDGLNAGFSEKLGADMVDPTITIGMSVSDQESDDDSVFNYYRQMIVLRKGNLTLQDGKYYPIDNRMPVVDYLRSYGSESVRVVANLSNKAVDINIHINADDVLINTNRTELEKGRLLPYQAIVYKV